MGSREETHAAIPKLRDCWTSRSPGLLDCTQERERALKKEQMGSRDETYAAIRKTLALLDDPFTRLLEPARYAALKDGNKGALTGVGLEVGSGPDGKGLVVSFPAECHGKSVHRFAQYAAPLHANERAPTVSVWE